MYKITFESPVGLLEIQSDGENITRLKTICVPDAIPDAECGILTRAKEELSLYFSGNLFDFTVPILPQGTEFQMKVWNALCRIPYGQTVTYASIAREIQNETASRAVGRACGMNPIWILIPCHRVVGANGSVTGYAGGIPMKKNLLELESRSVSLLSK